VLAALRARGCLAYGVDEDGYADWIPKATGPAGRRPEGPGHDFRAWYRGHE
jgi:hypothetical protein